MASEVILPRVDMDMKTGKISKWLVDAGATVTKGQPLFEIETDKATMEIEAEDEGTIRDLVEPSSEDLPVGSVVAWIDAAGESAAPKAPTDAREKDPEAASATPAKTENKAADGESKPESKAEAKPKSESKPEPKRAQDERQSSKPATAKAPDRPGATPLARRLARENEIDLQGLRGSGPRGRIRAEDVTGALNGQAASDNAVSSDQSKQEPAQPKVELRDQGRDGSVSRSGPQADKGALRQLREGSGRPLLLVHGFGSDTNGWRPVLQGLLPGRPVYGLDLPGHGNAARGDVASFEDLVEHVGAALSGFEAATDVMAHSLGAAVMTAVAARGLADVRSLLLLSPAGLGPDINGSFLRGFLDATSEAALTPWMHELVADPQLINASLVRATLSSRKGGDLADAQRQLAAALFPDAPRAFRSAATWLSSAFPRASCSARPTRSFRRVTREDCHRSWRFIFCRTSATCRRSRCASSSARFWRTTPGRKAPASAGSAI